MVTHAVVVLNSIGQQKLGAFLASLPPIVPQGQLV